MVMRKSLFVSIIVAAVLAFAGPASAVISVSVDHDPPSGPIMVNESEDITIRVSASSSDPIICPAEADVTISLSVEDGGDAGDYGFQGDVSPTSVSWSIPTGAYGVGMDEWTGDEQTVTFTAKVLPAFTPAHRAHDFTIVATYQGGLPGNCVGAALADEDPSPVEDTTRVSIEGQALPEEDGEDEEENGETQNGETEESPVPVVGILLLLVAGIVAMRRRD